MAETFVKYCGLDWPVNTPEAMAYLNYGRFGWSKKWIHRQTGEFKTGPEVGLPDPGEYFVKAAHLIFPKHVLGMNPWLDKMWYSMCNNLETMVLGASNCGKSCAAGSFALLWWVPAPDVTITYLSSTSREGLKRRAYGYLIQYFEALKPLGFPGIAARQTMAITQEDEERGGISALDARSGIFCLAVPSGDDTIVSGRIGGAHQDTMIGTDAYGKGSVAMISDECNAMAGAGAFYKVISNMISGCDLFRLCSLANPWSSAPTNAVGARATPTFGWEGIDIDTTHEWTSTKGAHVIRLDAYQSPGCKDPITYGYLPTKEKIAMILRENDMNDRSPNFLCMARAMVSDGSLSNSVFSMSLQTKYRVHEPPEWHSEPTDFYMAIDPAFAVDGDKCAVAVAAVGAFANGIRGVAIVDFQYLKLDGQSGVPVSYQLAHQINEIRMKYHIPMEHVGADSTGTQQLLDVVCSEAGEYGACEISFSARATTDPVSTQDRTPSNQRYNNLRSQIWMKALEYGRFGQLRGMPVPAAEEFSARRLLPKKLQEIEPKSVFKKRMAGASPDAADAVAMALYMVYKFGLYPGATVHNPRGGISFRTQAPRQSVDYDEINYSEQESY